jgi:biopolymer transport protein ExbB/TolQ
LQDRLPVSEWVTPSLRQAIDEASASLQSGMAVLASVGSTAPFVGLFGTVWGIYHALVSIGSGGQASIDKVAGPVGEALIMTALGLAVAIPATLATTRLARQQEHHRATEQVRFRTACAVRHRGVPMPPGRVGTGPAMRPARGELHDGYGFPLRFGR